MSKHQYLAWVRYIHWSLIDFVPIEGSHDMFDHWQMIRCFVSVSVDRRKQWHVWSLVDDWMFCVCGENYAFVEIMETANIIMHWCCYPRPRTAGEGIVCLYVCVFVSVRARNAKTGKFDRRKHFTRERGQSWIGPARNWSISGK